MMIGGERFSRKGACAVNLVEPKFANGESLTRSEHEFRDQTTTVWFPAGITPLSTIGLSAVL